MPKATKRKKTEPNVVIFKERLRTELKRQNDLGITQKAISENAEIGETTLSNWKSEKNTIMPSVYELSKLAAALEVNLEWLAGMTEEKTPDKTLAETGLTSEAIENLILIRHDDSSGMLSDVIESTHFYDFVKSLWEILELCNYVSDVSFSINDAGLHPGERMRLYNMLPDLIRSLKYGRYELTEHTFAIMNEIIPVSDTLEDAYKFIAQYESSLERTDGNGEKTE